MSSGGIKHRTWNRPSVPSALQYWIQVLYTLITFGVSYDPSVESELDQPDHLLRLRLVLTILDTCGVFFSSGLSKKRLDYYLHYLQVSGLFHLLSPDPVRWLPFPMDVLACPALSIAHFHRPLLQCYSNATWNHRERIQMCQAIGCFSYSGRCFSNATCVGEWIESADCCEHCLGMTGMWLKGINQTSLLLSPVLLLV